MKCEICHHAEAATVLHRRKPDGTDEELYVCRACAAEARHERSARPAADDATSPSPEDLEQGIVIGPGDKPPPFVENLLKATLGFMQGLAAAEKGKKATQGDVCPVCGMKRETAMKERRLGCPACWKTFADDIAAHLLDDQYGTVHAGRTPPADKGGDARAALQRQLKAAIRREAYEKAAEIKRRLAELDAATPPAESEAK